MTSLKHVATVRVSNIDKKSYDSELPVRLCNYTDVYYGDTIDASRGSFMAATASSEQIRNFRLAHGDIVLTKDSETSDDIGVSAFIAASAPDFVCGYHLAVVRPDPARVDPKFLFWATQSTAFRSQLGVSATGVTRFGLRSDALASTTVHLPPLKEQRQIADFLDDQVKLVDRAHELLIRSLTLADASFASGIDAELNAQPHDLVPLKRLLAISPSYGVLKPDRYDAPDGVPLVRTLDVTPNGTVKQDQLINISPTQDREYSRTRLQPGDIGLSVVGTIGRSFVATTAHAGFNLSRALARLVPNSEVHSEWLRWWLNSQRFQEFVNVTCQGTAQSVLNMGDLVNFPVGKPSIDGADQLRRLREASEAHLRRTALIKRQMTLLKERRQALITAAVTGRFDVTTARSLA